MGMQPLAHSPIAATQMLPTMPRAGEEEKEVKGETQQRAKATAPHVRACLYVPGGSRIVP